MMTDAAWNRRDVLRRAAHLGLSLGLAGSARVFAQGPAPQPAPERLRNRMRVPGTLELHTQRRVANGTGRDSGVTVQTGTVTWHAADTAIIICDMWDDHWCPMSAQRVGVLAPLMNAVVTRARERGVQIFHCPSDTLAFYRDTPYRRRMLEAPAVEPPVPLQRWCNLDPDHEEALPIDDSDNGCDSPDAPRTRRAWSRQHPGIDIVGPDGVSESGQEIYNFCRQEGIRNLAMMGVHTNMCVLGRSFGIRQMVRAGMNVVLVRDLTDAMYNPRARPFVSHARGTELVIEHVERFWCPTILAADLTRVVPGSDNPPAIPVPAGTAGT